MPFGSLTSVRLSQAEKTPSPISITLSGILMVFKLRQLQKAKSSIIVTDVGMVISDNL